MRVAFAAAADDDGLGDGQEERGDVEGRGGDADLQAVLLVHGQDDLRRLLAHAPNRGGGRRRAGPHRGVEEDQHLVRLAVEVLQPAPQRLQLLGALRVQPGGHGGGRGAVALESVAEDAEKAVEEDDAGEDHVGEYEEEKVPLARVEDAGEEVEAVAVVEAEAEHVDPAGAQGDAVPVAGGAVGEARRVVIELEEAAVTPQHGGHHVRGVEEDEEHHRSAPRLAGEELCVQLPEVAHVLVAYAEEEEDQLAHKFAQHWWNPWQKFVVCFDCFLL